MDKTTFIVELTKALVWPCIAITILLLFRTSIHGLLDGMKLRRFKHGGTEAEFSEGLNEIRNELPTQMSDLATKNTGLVDELESMIRSSPTTAVITAWKRVEYAIGFLAGKHNLVEQSFTSALNELARKKIIEPSIKDSILGLRQLRNLAVHGTAGEVSEARAREFLVITDAILWSMDSQKDKPLTK